jgi:dihydrofolate reductase
MLLGRVTYQEWADYWPTSTVEPFASHINRVPKYVVSNSLEDVQWGTHGKATLLKGSLADTVTTLKQQPGKSIAMSTPVESLLHAGLLDELRLEIYQWLLALSSTTDNLSHLKRLQDNQQWVRY